MKACIAKLTNEHDFPDKERTQKSYSHKLNVLVEAATLLGVRAAMSAASAKFHDNWETVCSWEETARYKQWSEAAARELISAISDPNDGVFAWIMAHW